MKAYTAKCATYVLYLLELTTYVFHVVCDSYVAHFAVHI